MYTLDTPKVPALKIARLQPLFVPLSTAMIAWVRSSAGFQPEMEPSSLTKMNRLGWELPLSDTLKKAVLLNTTPVGFPPSLLRAAVGVVGTRGTAVPSLPVGAATTGPR